MDKKSKKDKSAKSFRPEANLTLNQFNTSTNVFSQLSAQYLQQKQQETGDQTYEQFIKKNEKNKQQSFSQYDGEMQKILNQLNKKSEVTKGKALESLILYLDKQNEEFFVEFIQTWGYMYKQFMVSEIERKILEDANRVLLKIVEKNKKCIQKQFKEIFPTWFMSMNDIYNQEAQRVSIKAFNICFPQDKHMQALSFGSEKLLQSIKLYIKFNEQNVQKENQYLESSQAKEIADRLALQAMLSIKKAVQICKQNNQTSNKIIPELQEIIFQTFTDKSESKLTFINIFEDPKRIRVQGAAIEAFSEVFSVIEHIEDIDQNTLILFARAITQQINNSNRTIQMALWSNGTLVNLFKKLPSKIINRCDQKQVENKTLEILKECGGGIGQVFYKNLIVYLSLLPQAQIKKSGVEQFNVETAKEDKIKESFTFLNKFFDNFYKSRENEEVKSFHNDLIKSYYECLYFVALKRLWPVFQAEKFKTLRQQSGNFMKKFVLSFIPDFLQNYDPKIKIYNIYENVPDQIAQLFQILNNQDFSVKLQEEGSQDIPQQFVKFLVQGLQEQFQKVLENQNMKSFDNFCVILRKIVQKVDKNSISFTLLNEFLKEVHQKMVENITFQEGKIAQEIQQKVIFLKQYSQFSKILGENQDKSLVQDILESDIVNILQSISQNIQAIAKEMKFLSNQMPKLETVIFYMVQILYSWKKEEKLVKPIFVQVFQFLQENIYSKLDMGMVQGFGFIILGLHLVQGNLKENYFSEFMEKQKERKKEEQHLNNQLLLLQRDRNTYEFQQNFPEYQQFLLKFIEQLFRQINVYGKVVLPSIISLTCKFLSSENLLKMHQTFEAISMEYKSDILEKRQKNYYKIEKIEFLLKIENTIKSTFKNSTEIKDTRIFENILEILYFLYENKLKGKTSGFFTCLKVQLNQKLYQDYFFNSLRKIVDQQLTALFLQENTQNQEEKLDKFMNFVMDILEYLRQCKQQNYIEELLLQILDKKYFEKMLYNLSNWQLIKRLFQQAIIAIDFNTFLKKQFYNNNLQWLFAVILSSSSVQCIMDQINLRKYFIEFSSNFIKPILFEGIEESEERDTILQFFGYLQNISQNSSLIYLNGLKKLVKQCVAEDLDQKVLENLFDNLVQSPLKNLFENQQAEKFGQNNEIKQTLVIKSMLPIFQKKLDNSLLENTKNILQNTLLKELESDNQNYARILTALDLSAILKEQEFIVENHQQINSFLIENISDIFSVAQKHKNIADNYQIAVFFEYVNYIIEQLTIDPFTENLLLLEKLFKKTLEFNAKPREYSSESLSNILNFLRKIINFIEGFSEDFKAFTITSVLDTALIKFKSDEDQQQQDNLLYDEAYDLVITEFAETISRFVTVIDENLDENMLYELMNCKYPAIQKACFVLLNQFNQSFVPNVGEINIDLEDENCEQQLLDQILNPDNNLENMIHYLDCASLFTDKDLEQSKKQLQKKSNQDEQLIEEEFEDDDDEELPREVVDPKTYSYFMTWISFVNKINCPIENKNYDFVKRSLLIYLDEHKALHKNFLTVLFNCIDALELTEQEFKSIISPEEITRLNVEWSDFLCKESLFKLLIQALYIFCTKFPSYLRQWIDQTQDKKYIKLTECLIKNFISAAIFANEVETIELSQHEWQTEEFTIYAHKNTREIIAVFIKENQKLEIKLRVPPEYPIKPIETDVNRGVKINPLKINKWMMMMKSLLMNQNNNIKNILVSWKDNLDKEFDGLEECPICYYIVHSSTKELPKMSCKTCKYKFHSTCIHKWFNSSNKSECPMCKSQFF